MRRLADHPACPHPRSRLPPRELAAKTQDVAPARLATRPDCTERWQASHRHGRPDSCCHKVQGKRRHVGQSSRPAHRQGLATRAAASSKASQVSKNTPRSRRPLRFTGWTSDQLLCSQHKPKITHTCIAQAIGSGSIYCVIEPCLEMTQPLHCPGFRLTKLCRQRHKHGVPTLPRLACLLRDTT